MIRSFGIPRFLERSSLNTFWWNSGSFRYSWKSSFTFMTTFTGSKMQEPSSLFALALKLTDLEFVQPRKMHDESKTVARGL